MVTTWQILGLNKLRCIDRLGLYQHTGYCVFLGNRGWLIIVVLHCCACISFAFLRSTALVMVEFTVQVCCPCVAASARLL